MPVLQHTLLPAMPQRIEDWSEDQWIAWQEEQAAELRRLTGKEPSPVPKRVWKPKPR